MAIFEAVLSASVVDIFCAVNEILSLLTDQTFTHIFTKDRNPNPLTLILSLRLTEYLIIFFIINNES